jgi:DNA-directed RNA polymerase specialized sigma24 family protein
MADNEKADAISLWLPVIGKALAYLCLSRAIEGEPTKYAEVLAKVQFLQGLGLSQKEAAEAAGSTAESVRVMRHQRKKVKKNGKAKKKARSGR